jgi:hypothetical protein
MERDWTDKRMDDFADRVGRFEANVDARFDRIDARFATVASKEQLEKVEEVQTERFGLLMARMDKVDARLNRWGKVMSSGVVIIATAVILKVLGV